MTLAESDAICIRFRDEVLKQRGLTGPVNSFVTSKPSERKTLSNGIVLYTDLPYDSPYPNSFFDIWYPSEKEEKRPTVLFFHGGGCLFGDKMEGDPFAQGEASDCAVMKALAAQGYNVVSANYALAPEYRFPAQVIQVNDLVGDLIRKGDRYGLSMDDVVLMGSSAGANLTELYGAVISNEQYAKELGIQPALSPSCVRGLVIDEAALSIDRMQDWLFPMTVCWLGTEDLAHGKNAVLVDAACYATARYPRSFINASNADASFLGSAMALHSRLDDLGVENVLFYLPKEEAELHHGFLSHLETEDHAKECFHQIVHFLREGR